MNAFANGIKLTDDLERALIAQEVNHRYGFAPDIHSTSARAWQGRSDRRGNAGRSQSTGLRAGALTPASAPANG